MDSLSLRGTESSSMSETTGERGLSAGCAALEGTGREGEPGPSAPASVSSMSVLPCPSSRSESGGLRPAAALATPSQSSFSASFSRLTERMKGSWFPASRRAGVQERPSLLSSARRAERSADKPKSFMYSREVLAFPSDISTLRHMGR